jgi:hypothetical protein
MDTMYFFTVQAFVSSSRKSKARKFALNTFLFMPGLQAVKPDSSRLRQANFFAVPDCRCPGLHTDRLRQ